MLFILLGVLEKFEQNAMQYIHFIASEITKHRDLVAPQELWYEEDAPVLRTISEKKQLMEELRTTPRHIRPELLRNFFTKDSPHGAAAVHPVSVCTSLRNQNFNKLPKS